MTDIDPSVPEKFSPKYLMVEDSCTKKIRRISYYKVDGRGRTGVVFIPGFTANKEYTKSIEILEYCLRNDIQCISYDATGFGDSVHEIKKNEARFPHWLQDAREVLLKLTDGPQIIVGSSMGGWIGMILAQEIPEKFASLLLLSPAYNYGEKYLRDIEEYFPQEIKEQMRQGLLFEIEDPTFPDYGPIPFSYDLFEGSLPYNISLEEDKIDINIPVRIVHGAKDVVIPLKTSEVLIDAIKSDDVTLTTIKDCTHEFSDPKGLRVIFEHIQALLKLASPSLFSH